MESLSIKQLLEKSLIVPEIQREYVWGNEELVVKNFLLDLDNALSSDSEKNVGFLYSYKVGNTGLHYIIDGQQRLTTLVLLLYYYASKNDVDFEDFKSKLRINDSIPAFSYSVRPLTDQFCFQLFGRKFSDIDELKNRNTYVYLFDDDTTVEAMQNALKSFLKYEAECRNITYQNLLDNVKFWYFDVEHTSQGEELYITMNSRGQKLTESEQIKPFLFEKEKQPQKDYGKRWDEWEEFFYSKRGARNIMSVNVAMNNFVRIVIELNTCKEIDKIIPARDKDFVTLQDLDKYFLRLKNLWDEIEQFCDNLFEETRNDKSSFIITALIGCDDLNEINKKSLLRIILNCCEYKTVNRIPLLEFIKEYNDSSEKNIYKFVKIRESLLRGKNVDNEKDEEYQKIIAIVDGIVSEENLIKVEQDTILGCQIHCLYRDGDGKVYWGDWVTKYENYQSIILEKSQKDRALALRTLISYFDNWGYFWNNLVYDNQDSSWKNILTNSIWQIPVHQLLINGCKDESELNRYQSNFGYNVKQKTAHEDMVRSTLLNCMTLEPFKFNWKYEHYLFHPASARAESKKYVIGTPRNEILQSLFESQTIMFEPDNENKPNCKYRIYDSGYFWGYGVGFKYKTKDILWEIDRENNKEYLKCNDKKILIDDYTLLTKDQVVDILDNL